MNFTLETKNDAGVPHGYSSRQRRTLNLISAPPPLQKKGESGQHEKRINVKSKKKTRTCLNINEKLRDAADLLNVTFRGFCFSVACFYSGLLQNGTNNEAAYAFRTAPAIVVVVVVLY